MDILRKIKTILVLLFCTLVSHPAQSAAQVTSFNDFSDQSWKSFRTEINGHDVTIEQHLVREFNAADWGPWTEIRDGTEVKVTNHPIKRLNGVVEYFGAAANPPNWMRDLRNNDTPRKWTRNLNLREIYRFKSWIRNGRENLISDANFPTDDLVKARSLCGAFWKVDTSGHDNATKIFSGILVPGQPFANASYQVYTCMHGFSFGNSTHNIAYYFVPYGVEVDSNPRSQRYVGHKGFKVTQVQHFRGDHEVEVGINDFFFQRGLESISAETLYREKDFAIATIEGETSTHTPLKDILLDVGLINGATTQLPTINALDGLAPVDINADFNPNEERLFSIGVASKPRADLSHGIIVAPSLTREDVLDSPLRSFGNNENEKNPVDIRSRPEERSSSVPSYPGMSGGPILRCRLDPANEANKKCAIVGTIWGAERVFSEAGRLIRFENFINRLLPFS